MNWFSNSRLFELAHQGKRLTHVAAVIPLSFLFALVSQLGVIPLFIIMGPSRHVACFLNALGLYLKMRKNFSINRL